MAEKEGFEPSKRFCRLHDFQSCALDQLGDFSIVVSSAFPHMHLFAASKTDSVIIITENRIKSSPIFCFF